MLNNLTSRRDFLVAVAGSAVSAFGDEAALVALTLRVQAHHGRPYEVAALLAAGLVPVLLLNPWAGRLVDSHDSRRLLISASAVQAACCAALVFAVRPDVVIPLVALLGAGTAVAQPTWQALLPRIVGEDNIGRASALQQTATTLSMLGAPAAGGLLSGAFGTGVPVALDAVTFAVMGVAAALVHTRRRGADRDKDDLQPGGWAVIRSNPTLALLTAGLGSFVLLTMMVNVVEVFLVRVTLHGTSAWYGVVMAAWIAGMVGGSLAATRLRSDDARLLATLTGALAISSALSGYGVVPDVAGLLPLSILGGIGNGLINSSAGALVMSSSAEHVRGRVSATVGAVASAASLVSLVLGGVLGSVLAPRAVLLAAGGMGFVVAGVAVAWWHARPLDREPSATPRIAPVGSGAARPGVMSCSISRLENGRNSPERTG